MRLVLVALFTGNHMLLEGSSSLGKTKLAKSLGSILGLKFSRIQCTPDLMPTDVLGFSAAEHFRSGPIFANVVLVDEINRATPKTQSALLEAMEERQVTNGKRRDLPRPFFVIATQNSSGSIGTYPLPEAQLDRFGYALRMELPQVDILSQVIGKMLRGEEVGERDALITRSEVLAIQKSIESVAVPAKIIDYVSRIIVNTHPDRSPVPSVRKYVEQSATIRAERAIIRGAQAQALLSDRSMVAVDDVKMFFVSALSHRLVFNMEGLAAQADPNQLVTIEKIITDIIQATEF